LPTCTAVGFTWTGSGVREEPLRSNALARKYPLRPSATSHISNRRRKADACRGFGRSLLARRYTQLRAHRKKG